MLKSYSVGKAAPGFYRSDSSLLAPVTVDVDEEGQRFAFTNDQESLDTFVDQMLGFITGSYKPYIVNGLLVDSADELLRRAALWEQEANSGFKSHRSEGFRKQAESLFERALRVSNCKG